MSEAASTSARTGSATSSRPGRRLLAPNVIALWPEDRPAVENPAAPQRSAAIWCAGRGIPWLPLRPRLRVGDFAYLWGSCPHNRGLLVRLLSLYPDGDWEIEGITGPIMSARKTLQERTAARPDQLRRCAAPLPGGDAVTFD